MRVTSVMVGSVATVQTVVVDPGKPGMHVSAPGALSCGKTANQVTPPESPAFDRFDRFDVGDRSER